MLMTPEDLILADSTFAEMSYAELTALIASVEAAIRSYTNNRFQVRRARMGASSNGPVLALTEGTLEFFQPGDTVQITETDVNDGLYVIESVDAQAGTVTVDNDLFALDWNLVTKVQYPKDVIAGAVRMMNWMVTMGDKTGVASETLSRHTVTYAGVDASNTVMGYPVSLMGSLGPYRKARF